jgi:hypothetical protein
MTPPEDIINDVKVFISLWKDVAKKIKEDSNILSKEYGVTDEEYDYEDGSYFFTIKGMRYKWDWNEEELYNLNEKVISGPAYEYVIKNNASVKNAYDIIETEMTNRGWYYDQEEYEYYISKNGWQTTLPYFCESIEDVREFEWDAELLE